MSVTISKITKNMCYISQKSIRHLYIYGIAPPPVTPSTENR